MCYTADMNISKIMLAAAMAAGLACSATADDAYLEATGAQAINTGYHVTPLTRIVVDYAFTSATPTQQRVFGAASDDTSAVLSCAHYINSGGQYAWAFRDGIGNWESLGVAATTDRRMLDMDGYRNKLSLLTGSAVTASVNISTLRTRSSARPLAIFANTQNEAGTSFNNYGRVRLYSFDIYEADRLVHCYRPYRSADGTVVGLKDLTDGTILTDAVGTTAFAYGGDISADPVCGLEGYRLNAQGALEWRLRIVPAANGTVTVDGTPISEAFEEWHAWGDTATHTLTATAAAGCFFADWKGDVTVPGSGTTTFSYPTTLTPTFWEIATPVHDINVASGTLDITQWMEDNGVVISGGGTIRKTGAGILTVTNDVLSSFTGDVYVEGGELKTFAANPLGPANSGRIVVDNGATLHHSWPAGATSAVSFGNKPVYARGTGVSGKSAVYVTTHVGNVDSGNPNVIYLIGDMNMLWNRHTRINGSVYLEGHTLSVGGIAGWDYWQPGVYDTTGRGNITITKELLLQGLSLKFGSSRNEFRIKTGASLRTYGWQPANGTWTLIFEDYSYIYPSGGEAVWKGPVVLNGRTPIIRQVEWAAMRFSGVVSGPGGIGRYGATGSGDYTCHHAKIHLAGTANTFMGGLWLYNNVLTVAGNGSVPANGGGLTNYLGSVIFQSAGPYDLPEAYFSGTGRVYSASGVARATGTWRRQVLKTGDGTMDYDCSIGGPFLDVQGTGSFRYPAAGEGVVAPPFAKINILNGATLDANGHDVTVPDLVGLGTVSNGSVTVSAKYHVNCVRLADGQTMRVTDGAFTFGDGTELSLQNVEALNRNTIYTVATASGGITPARIPTSDRFWKAHVEGNSLKIYHIGGTTLTFR